MAQPLSLIRDVANTGTGNQTFSGDLGGATPIGAIFFINPAVAADTQAANINTCIGMTDGTRERCAFMFSLDGDAETAAAGGSSNTQTIKLIDEAGTETAAATFVSFAGDQVTINWSNAPAGAFFMTVLLFGGNDINNFYVGDDTTTSAGASSNTDPGFAGNHLIAACPGPTLINTNTSVGDSFGLSYGHAIDSTTIELANVLIAVNDADTGSSGTTHFRDGELVSAVDSSDETSVEVTQTLDSFDATGFTLSASSGNNVAFIYAFIEWVNTSFSIDTETTAAAGTQDYTSSSIDTPDFVFTMGTKVTTTTIADAAVGWGFSDGGTNDRVLTCGSDDTGANNSANSRADNIMLGTISGGGDPFLYKADWDSWLSNGYRVDFTTGETGKKFVSVVLRFGGIAGSASGSSPIFF